MNMAEVRLPVVLFMILLGHAALLNAQSEQDAYRISDVQPGGTGRSNGIANAFGALGADAVVVGINPAGFGLYRSTEISLTPGFEVNDARSTYYGTSSSGTATRVFFNNLGLIINSPSEKGGNWRSSTYGIVYDRQESSHWQSRAIGSSVPSTILQSFVNEANGTQDSDLYDFFPFTSGLAWNTYAIDPVDSTGTSYFPAIPFGSPTEQEHTIDSHGANNNTTFFYSANYMDRFYIGASLGIAGHRYKRNTVHRETSLDEEVGLRTVRYTEDLNTTGNGFDLKVGLIGRFTERFRMGIAYHSPRWMQLRDDFVYSMTTEFRVPDAEGRTSYEAFSPDGSFSYRVNTPWRAVLSAAYIAGSHGLVSVDYEYADFRTMRMASSDLVASDYDFSAENEAIQNAFRATHTVRVGTEWRAGNWYYRGGWGFSPNAYKEQDARHGQAQRTYAFGLGYRTDHIGVDLAVNHRASSLSYFQYDPSTVEPTTVERRSYQALVTLSYRP